MLKNILGILVLLWMFTGEGGAANADFDNDGTVGISDFLLFVDAFGTSPESENWDAKFDLNSDGTVDVQDYLLFVDQFGNTVSRKTVVDTLDLREQGITAVRADLFADYDSVKVLRLENNVIGVIEPGAFDSLSTLRKIFMQGNLIEKLF